MIIITRLWHFIIHLFKEHDFPTTVVQSLLKKLFFTTQYLRRSFNNRFCLSDGGNFVNIVNISKTVVADPSLNVSNFNFFFAFVPLLLRICFSFFFASVPFFFLLMLSLSRIRQWWPLPRLAKRTCTWRSSPSRTSTMKRWWSSWGRSPPPPTTRTHRGGEEPLLRRIQERDRSAPRLVVHWMVKTIWASDDWLHLIYYEV